MKTVVKVEAIMRALVPKEQTTQQQRSKTGIKTELWRQLDHAARRAEARQELPYYIRKIPGLGLPGVRHVLLKSLSYFFKDQRAATLATLEAVRSLAETVDGIALRLEALEDHSRNNDSRA